jgi:hypothetical protein
VAVSGETIVIGANREDSSATGVNGNQADNSILGGGAAYVFVRSGTTWAQQAYLKASNTGEGDNFGFSVAISGATVVVGAIGEYSGATGVNGDQADNSAGDAGAAYVFVRSGTTWTQQAYLKASNTGASDRFGNAVAIAGNTVVVGAYFEDSNAAGVNGNGADNSADDSGAVYVFLLPLPPTPPAPTNPLATPASICNSGDPASLSVADPGAGIVIDWFAGSCGGTLIGTGNPFNVSPAETTTYFARSRNTSSGNTSDSCALVVVTVEQCCPADFNGDGFIDFTDFDGFVAAFEAGDTSGDFNADGFIDFTDFDAYVTAFEAGC